MMFAKTIVEIMITRKAKMITTQPKSLRRARTRRSNESSGREGRTCGTAGAGPQGYAAATPYRCLCRAVVPNGRREAAQSG